jgi:hypothetical protein
MTSTLRRNSRAKRVKGILLGRCLGIYCVTADSLSFISRTLPSE